MPDDTHADLVLDRFWDALVDDSVADSGELDQQAAASLRQLHAMASAPAPIESRERVRHRLNGLSAADHEHAVPPIDHPMPVRSLRRDPVAADGHLTMPTARSLAAPQAIHGARRWTAILATAAIVLLAMAVSIRSLSPNLFGDRGNVPAVPAPDAQSSDKDETLVALELTADEAGFGGSFGTELGRFRVPAGSTDQWPGTNSQESEPRMVHIERGTLRIRADHSLRIVRKAGDGVIEQSVPDTWFVLGPGDTLLRVPQANLELQNPGSEPAIAVDWTIGRVNQVVTSEPRSWQQIAYTTSGDGTAPTGPVLFRLRHVTLAPDATILSPTGAYFQQYLNLTPEGATEIGQTSDFAITNKGQEPAELYIVTLEPVSQTAAVPESESSADGTLVDVILPGEQLQTPGRFNSIMGYYAVPAGSHDSWSGPTDIAPEPLVWHVLSGSYTVRSDEVVQIARAGESGKTTLVAAGTESKLGPGDSLVRPAGSEMELANNGSEPVLLVVWTLGDINVQGPSLPSSWDSLPCYPGETSGTAPNGPSRLQLRLVTIAPNATLAAPPGAFVQQYLDLTSEAPNLGLKSDYSLINQGTRPATLFIVSLEPASPDEATPDSST